MTQNLVLGFKKFKNHYYGETNSLMTRLVDEGQDPKYFIISCIDSRSNPGTIFNSKPGVFFAHKAMGAIVRPYKQGTALSAALQFAVNYNNIKTIIVLGHTQCGAIKALCDGLDDEEIKGFIEFARKALNKAKTYSATEQDVVDHTEKEVILQSAENLKTYPSIKAALGKGEVEIKPWLFDMVGGNLLEYDEKSKKFFSISD